GHHTCHMTALWSFSEVRAQRHHVRYSPLIGHRRPSGASPKSANNGSRGHHSITPSARTSSDNGTVNPSAWAVLRLIANWYFVRACAGRLAGFSPLKVYRIEALLQDKTSMITASTATIRRTSTPLGFEAALSRTGTEASARACARSESAAWEAVTSWAGSARKPSRARVLSLPGSP